MKGRKFTAKPAVWTKLKSAARVMRREPTPAENALWDQLRNRRFKGLKFRRQHTVGRFIVDFLCADESLVVEIDGPIHRLGVQKDQIREKFLERHGLRVIRFTNEEILFNLDHVLQRLGSELKNRTPEF